jgi:hypothetical protein
VPYGLRAPIRDRISSRQGIDEFAAGLHHQTQNRDMLSWVGGGIVAVAVGAWAVVTYVWPAHEAAGTLCAQSGGVAGRDASGNAITYNGGVSPGGAAPCTDAAKR